MINKAILDIGSVMTIAASALLLSPATTFAEEPRSDEVEFSISLQEDGSIDPNPFLASGVAIGNNVGTYRTAGTGPSGGNNPGAESPDPEFWIDPELISGYSGGGALPEGMSLTEAQGINALNRVKEHLEENDLSLDDVIFLRIYLESPEGQDRADYSGWNRAYRKYFANVDRDTGEPIEKYDPVFVNMTRPARSNIEVATLPVKGWLVEIEAVAVYGQ